ncbi:MAG: S8 family serine peptidase, partial [Caldilineaceae bacterium]
MQRFGGQVTSNLWLINGVGAILPASQLSKLSTSPGIHSLVANQQVASSGSSDGHSWLTTDKGWPFAKDVGADIVHARSITGKGIAVAVIDSGVFYDPLRMMMAGSESALRFIGQADMLGESSCTPQSLWQGLQSGWQTFQSEQHSDFCLKKYYGATDGYGHGTHVAGIIGNGFRDANTNISLGIAPAAQVVSLRALGNDGTGVYENTIRAIQSAVELKDAYNIRIINLSLSATASVPYFVDPLNRAVEAAWADGIVVLAAAGNSGAQSETITVPGNDPYIITVGGLNTNRTPGDWSDDILPVWSSTGPTLDGFIKPDVLAPGSNIVSFMYNSALDQANIAALARIHPDFSITEDLFRMSGTSMATAVASGVVALMLEANPALTPDQVKFRLAYSAMPAVDQDDIAYNLLQQGAGRIWAPDAVFGNFPSDARANVGMDILQDLSHGYEKKSDLAYHYGGPIRKQTSDDGASVLYYAETVDGEVYGFGSTDSNSSQWLSWETLDSRVPTWSGSFGAWNSPAGTWAGGYSYSAGMALWSGRIPTWSGGLPTWSGGVPTWSGGIPTWSGGMTFAGGIPTWSGGVPTWSGRVPTWSGGIPTWSGGMDVSVGATRWVQDDKAAAPPTLTTGALSMQVTDLDGSTKCVDRRCKWDAQVTLRVADNLSAPVAGATATFDWKTSAESGKLSCTTDKAGSCKVNQRINSRRGQITFAVSALAYPGLTYASASQGEHNTTITLNRPAQGRASAEGDMSEEGDILYVR